MHRPQHRSLKPEANQQPATLQRSNFTYLQLRSLQLACSLQLAARCAQQRETTIIFVSNPIPLTPQNAQNPKTQNPKPKTDLVELRKSNSTAVTLC